MTSLTGWRYVIALTSSSMSNMSRCDIIYPNVWYGDKQLWSVTNRNKIYSDVRVCPPQPHLVETVIMWHYGDTSWRHHDVPLNVTLQLLSPVWAISSLVKKMLVSILVSILSLFLSLGNSKMIKLFMYIIGVRKDIPPPRTCSNIPMDRQLPDGEVT